MSKGVRSYVDLRFGDLVILNNEITFKGNKGGNISKDGERIEKPPVEECNFRISPDKFLGMLTRMLLSLTKNNNSEGEKEENNSAVEKQKAEEEIHETNDNQTRPERVVLRGRNGSSLIITPLTKRKLARFSVAKFENKEIAQITYGLVRPAGILTLMNATGKILCATDPYVNPIQGIASLFYTKGTVSFISKTGESSALDEWQKKELMFALTARFLAGEKYPLNFRVGLVSLLESEDGDFIFGFRKNEAIISPEDLGIIWSVCMQ